MNRKMLWIWILVSILFSVTAVPLLAQEVAHTPVAHKAPSFISILLQPKFVTMFLLAIVAILLLYTRRMGEKTRVALLLFATFAFGIAGNLPGKLFHAYAMHPSAICASTKPFLIGLRLPLVVTIVVIAILTLIGPKLFCSYICPVGAVQ
ncbi:MAG: 4Fe-4S binding protein, partial [Holophagae bacterium]|nr:4Fe-4S binding protein [Holophagae bacterium]